MLLIFGSPCFVITWLVIIPSFDINSVKDGWSCTALGFSMYSSFPTRVKAKAEYVRLRRKNKRSPVPVRHFELVEEQVLPLITDIISSLIISLLPIIVVKMEPL